MIFCNHPRRGNFVPFSRLCQQFVRFKRDFFLLTVHGPPPTPFKFLKLPFFMRVGLFSEVVACLCLNLVQNPYSSRVKACISLLTKQTDSDHAAVALTVPACRVNPFCPPAYVTPSFFNGPIDSLGFDGCGFGPIAMSFYLFAKLFFRPFLSSSAFHGSTFTSASL